MNHPKPEEWVPYIFGEAKPETREELRQHFENCPECHDEFKRWKRSLGRLNSWRLPKMAETRELFAPVFNWALGFALVLMLGLVFVLGRLSSSAADSAKLRSAITSQVRQELQAEFSQWVQDEIAKASTTTFATVSEQTKTLLGEYDQAVNARIEAERIERVRDCMALKRDVDTVAINADDGLRNTQQRLAQMTAYH